MISREKIHKILTLVLEISERGEDENGYPYISFEISNLGHRASLYAMKDGFSTARDYEINMLFDSDSEADRAIKKLKKLLKIAVDRIEE